MFNTLARLFAEQTTADEVIIFVLLCVGLALLFAFGLYALILSVLWRDRQRKVASLRRLLFPSGAQLREYLAEYVLAFTTSWLLTLTEAARDNAVHNILDYPLVNLASKDIVRALPLNRLDAKDLAPLGQAPDSLAETLASASTGDAAARARLRDVPVGALLQPQVMAGTADHAALWLKLAVKKIEYNPWTRFPKRGHLLASAIALLLLYVVWFARQRSRAIDRAGAPTETEYISVLRRLLAPAVCIALLLVSAASASNPERVASAAAAIPRMTLPDHAQEPARRFGQALDHQLGQLQSVAALVEVGDTVPAMLRRLARLDSQLVALQDTTGGLGAAVAETATTLRELQQRLSALGDRLDNENRNATAERAALQRQLAAVEESLRRFDARMSGVESGVQSAQSQANRAMSGTDALRGQLDLLGRELRDLRSTLEKLAAQPTTGLLYVVITPAADYTIRPSAVARGGGRVGGRGTGSGLHALPPGQYVVNSIGSGETNSVTISAGSATTVRLSGQKPIGLLPPPAAR